MAAGSGVFTILVMQIHPGYKYSVHIYVISQSRLKSARVCVGSTKRLGFLTPIGLAPVNFPTTEHYFVQCWFTEFYWDVEPYAVFVFR